MEESNPQVVLARKDFKRSSSISIDGNEKISSYMSSTANSPGRRSNKSPQRRQSEVSTAPGSPDTTITQKSLASSTSDDTLRESSECNKQDGTASPLTTPMKDANGITLRDTKVTIDIGPQHFDLLKLIGEGAFGKVILVRNRLNKQLYAMKVITKKKLKRRNNQAYMKSERDILTKVQRLFLVMDFLGGGELFYHLRKKGLILESEAQIYFAELVLAIEFLHDCGVVHRDLKPENVLLHSTGHVCVTDFGLAKEVGDNNQVRTLCGTSEYMAPEMLLRNGYTKAVDWWSLGALFYEMLAGKPPFECKRGETSKDLDRKILTAQPSIPGHLRKNTISLIRGMLEKDSNKRLGSARSDMFTVGGVSALKSHVFFEDMDWRRVYECDYPPPIDLQKGYEDQTVKLQKEAKLAQQQAASSRREGGASSGKKGKKGGQATPQQRASPVPLAGNSTGKTPTPTDTASTPLSAEDGTRVDGNEGATFLSLNPAAHFDIEFTSQMISPSVVEDSLSLATTPASGGTPVSIYTSREGTPMISGSTTPKRQLPLGGVLGAPGVDSADPDLNDYKDFSYTMPGFAVTEEQVIEFQTELADKLAKAAIKQKKKEKKEKDSARRTLLYEGKLALEKEEAEALTAKGDGLTALDDERYEKTAEIEKEMERIKSKYGLLEKALEHSITLGETLMVVKKRLKGTMKKLTAIEDLRAKIENGAVVPSNDQQDKLSRESELIACKARDEEECAVVEGEIQSIFIEDSEKELLLLYQQNRLPALLSLQNQKEALVPLYKEKKQGVEEVYARAVKSANDKYKIVLEEHSPAVGVTPEKGVEMNPQSTAGKTSADTAAAAGGGGGEAKGVEQIGSEGRKLFMQEVTSEFEEASISSSASAVADNNNEKKEMVVDTAPSPAGKYIPPSMRNKTGSPTTPTGKAWGSSAPPMGGSPSWTRVGSGSIGGLGTSAHPLSSPYLGAKPLSSFKAVADRIVDSKQDVPGDAGWAKMAQVKTERRGSGAVWASTDGSNVDETAKEIRDVKDEEEGWQPVKAKSTVKSWASMLKK